jgi:hypothetical protein
MNRTSNPSSFLSFMAAKVRTASSFNCSRGQSQATMPTYASIISRKFEATQKKKITNGPMSVTTAAQTSARALLVTREDKFTNPVESQITTSNVCKRAFRTCPQAQHHHTN